MDRLSIDKEISLKDMQPTAIEVVYSKLDQSNLLQLKTLAWPTLVYQIGGHHD